MKIVLSFILIAAVNLGFAQDTTKTTKKVVNKQVSFKVNTFPKTSLGRIQTNDSKKPITGKFLIEKYVVQVKTAETKKAITAKGSVVEITEKIISGEQIEDIAFIVNETTTMNTQDYLYRIFGVVPETVPSDLPDNLTVHITNNLDCYGIGQLSNGTLLIPYKGLLLYLKRG